MMEENIEDKFLKSIFKREKLNGKLSAGFTDNLLLTINIHREKQKHIARQSVFVTLGLSVFLTVLFFGLVYSHEVFSNLETLTFGIIKEVPELPFDLNYKYLGVVIIPLILIRLVIGVILLYRPDALTTAIKNV